VAYNEQNKMLKVGFNKLNAPAVVARGQGEPDQMTWLKGFRPGCHFFL